MKNILVLGATSSIAQAYLRLCTPAGARFWLLGRNLERLRAVAADLTVRGAMAVEVRALAPGSFEALEDGITAAFDTLGHVDVFLAAQGALPDQEECERAPASLREFFQGSAVEVMQAALLVASRLEKQGRGVCVIIGSVAGDRGRRGNYVYGSAKAALDTFCDGLRQRMAQGCCVIFMKPGPVDTPMTAHMVKTALFTTPEKVALVMARAVERQASGVFYAPGYWRWIMFFVKCLPCGVVKKLRA